MSEKHKQQLFTILLVLLIIQVGLIYLYLKKGNSGLLNSVQNIGQHFGSESTVELVSHRSYFSKLEFYDEAYRQATNQIPQTNKYIYGGIIPHHLMVKDKIAAYFSALEDKYDTVVLIAPNHFQAGEDDILLSKAKWQTPYGELLPDIKNIDRLNDYFNIEEEPFANEHAVSGLVPFIKNSLPKAKIIPIIIKTQTDNKKLDNLAQLLKTLDKDKTLILASVDFSHFQTSLVADFHDQQSIGIIQSFDLDRLSNIEVDSPESLQVLLKYLSDIESENGQLAFHSNSSELLNLPDDPGTSHQFWYFSKGSPLKENIISFLFFGDLMLDRNVGTKIEEYGLDYLFTNLAGEENRFFMGPDLIAANLEGAVTQDGQHYLPTVPYDFAFDPNLIKQIKNNYNFNYFTIANNHVTDQGSSGLQETLKNLDNLQINFSGCSDAEIAEGCAYKILNISDQKIAMISLSMVYHMFDEQQAIDLIKKLDNENNLVIINIHWGVEYEHYFNQTQQNLAHQFINAGADIIIGHHPHVVQGMEIYQDRPIFYSLGNFIFDQYFSPDTQEELAVGINYNTFNKKYTVYLLPLISTASQPSPMKGQEKTDFLQKYFDWSELNQQQEQAVLSSKISL